MQISRRQLLCHTGVAAVGLALARGPAAAAPARPRIRLTGNENPYGPPEAARRAIIRAAGDGNRYVRLDDVEALRGAIAARHDLPTDHVLLAPGSQSILDLVSVAIARDGRVVAADPSYRGFVRHAEKLAVLDLVPLDERMTHDLDAMERRVSPDTRLVYVCNPNNPTGTIVAGDRLRGFCRTVAAKTPVVVDEAYADYVEDPAFASMIPLVRTGADVIVARTFSKAFGMAGLRIGYALARPKLLQKLADFCSAGDMWLGALSVRAALAGIGDEAFVVSSRRRNAEVRADTVKALRALGLVPAESHTNFVYFRVPGRLETLRAALEARGVEVGGRPNPWDAMRVTIGRPDEMRAFHVALRDALSAA